MKKILCLLLCLCLLSAFGGAFAASGEASVEPSGEASQEASQEPSAEPSQEASDEVPEQTDLDLSFNGIRVADMGVDVSTDGQGQYSFSLSKLLNLLGLEMSYDEQGNLEIRDKLGILGALLD